jgi:alkanesulfonate monooxygenase SsuD/methylene tetrahydromethanopterin reductase-like flavin-dependent oxidoreductase (luciferase family)
MEGDDTTFVDPFVTLAAAAAVTRRCALGTAVVIPIRWPLKLAQEFASLDFLAPGRVVAGIGMGFNPKEFEAVGLNAEERDEILDETVAILRQAWVGPVTHHGRIFRGNSVDLNPKPAAPIPLLYGGTTPAGVRRAARLADGWYVGRLPLATLDVRLEQLRNLTAGRERPPYTVIQPLVIVDDTYEKAARRVPIRQVAESSEGARFWVAPASGEFRTIADLRGLVMCGTPEDVVSQLADFRDRGIDEVVLDFRLQFGEYDAVLSAVGVEAAKHLGGPAMAARASHPAGAPVAVPE